MVKSAQCALAVKADCLPPGGFDLRLNSSRAKAANLKVCRSAFRQTADGRICLIRARHRCSVLQARPARAAIQRIAAALPKLCEG